MKKKDKPHQFRIWDKLNKQYVSNYSEDWYVLDEYGQLQRLLVTIHGTFFDYKFSDEQRKNLKVERYTGFEDCEGNPIFEGDIIADKYYKKSRKTVLYDIKNGFYVKEKMPYVFHAYRKESFGEYLFSLSDSKIVGNTNTIKK